MMPRPPPNNGIHPTRISAVLNENLSGFEVECAASVRRLTTRMGKLLNKSRVLLVALLALPFALLAATRVVGWVGGGGDLSFLLLLLCILSVYVSLAVSVVTLGCGVLFWFLTVVDFKRGRLLSLVLLACANIVASILWMGLFVRHVRFRY